MQLSAITPTIRYVPILVGIALETALFMVASSERNSESPVAGRVVPLLTQWRPARRANEKKLPGLIFCWQPGIGILLGSITPRPTTGGWPPRYYPQSGTCCPAGRR